MTAKDLIQKVRKTVHLEKGEKIISEKDNRTILAAEDAELKRKSYASQLTHH